MIFITGGASQGKKVYAVEHFPGKTIVDAYQEQIKRWLLEDKEVLEETKRLLSTNSDIVILMNEMGCGITPMEAFDRRFRDEVGQAGCYLAKEAKEVHRVIAGIGIRIK